MAIVDLPAPGMRWETTSEHIARDMAERRFPEMSERQQVPDEDLVDKAQTEAAAPGSEPILITPHMLNAGVAQITLPSMDSDDRKTLAVKVFRAMIDARNSKVGE